MILIDTSVWVDHLRASEPELKNLLNANDVLMHPMVIGELACGYIRNRKQALENWRKLPKIKEASHGRVISAIEAHKLMGLGLGLVDIHLFCSVLDHQGSQIWTRDKKLNGIANKFNIGFENNH